MVMMWHIICGVALLAVTASSASVEDLVVNLPGLSFTPPFKHYAGYLNVSQTKRYYYNFIEAYENPSTAPVILWVQGGPGCSSLYGMLNENGPYFIKDEGTTLYENPHAWNRAGNMLYFDAPVGVGYSYETEKSSNPTDESTADDNHAALVAFFQTFPEFRSNDFFVIGESYGGMYVPMLSVRVADDKKNFPNFKGMAVGNGVFSFELSFNTWVPFLYYHGLIQERVWMAMVDVCCHNQTYGCNFFQLTHNGSQECRNLITKGFQGSKTGDDYNLYSACYTDDKPQNRILRSHLSKVVRLESPKKPNLPLCAQTDNDYKYMGRAEVREALHVHPDAPRWEMCSTTVEKAYRKTRYDTPVFPEFHHLIAQKKRILVYNGDLDTVCNVLLSSQFVEQLGLEVLEDPKNRTFWSYDGEIPDKAGFMTRYKKNVDFLTVRGSGHMVPKDKPKEALQMIYNFVHDRDYSEKIVSKH